MTNEDALFFLGRFRTTGINEHLYEALGVAIKALSKQVKDAQPQLDAEFAEAVRAMFADIWDREIDHPKYQDTVGEILEDVIKLYNSVLLSTQQPEIVRCKDCKHNPKDTWFECPMSHLSEKQRPETAWCWKGERRTDA